MIILRSLSPGRMPAITAQWRTRIGEYCLDITNCKQKGGYRIVIVTDTQQCDQYHFRRY